VDDPVAEEGSEAEDSASGRPLVRHVARRPTHPF
jgi:hypothetical protein